MLFKRRCKITFISHGSTIYTEENRLSDNENYPPLNDKGKEEAERIAQWIVRRSPRVDHIYTSPALRCTQTAAMVAKAYQKDFEILDKLHNKLSGVWSGLSLNQIEDRYPELLNKYHDAKADFWPEGGETLKDLKMRVENFLAETIQNNIAKRIIIVTYPDIIKSAVASALHIPLKNQNKIFIPTGSVSQINYYVSWECLVYSGHLPLK